MANIEVSKMLYTIDRETEVDLKGVKFSKFASPDRVGNEDDLELFTDEGNISSGTFYRIPINHLSDQCKNSGRTSVPEKLRTYQPSATHIKIPGAAFKTNSD